MHRHAASLADDLNRLLQLERHHLEQRRRALRGLAAGALAGGLPWMLQACGGGDDMSGTTGSSTAGGSSTTGSSTSTTGSCSVIPNETAGPYPGDGTNSNASGLVNVLTLSGIVRSDIRSSIGSASGTAAGVPLRVTLRLVNTASSCVALEGYAVYLWHCTRDGGYSLYSTGVTGENYLRGVQVTNASGEVMFTTIFPGCYSGRWPHMHFEVYPSLASATSGSNDIKTSQLALPAAACSQVYSGASGYNASVANFAAISLASDNVFGNDSAAQQLASVTGDNINGYAATLTVGL
jgi:protocatechuate 3,4-dioxygenase beta subunit